MKQIVLIFLYWFNLYFFICVFNIQVATKAFKKLATSVQSMSKLRGDINVIQSTQTIEEFAFKYASFNLNTSHTEERKENKHIGKKTTKLFVNEML